jgi:hypothetical protein
MDYQHNLNCRLSLWDTLIFAGALTAMGALALFPINCAIESYKLGEARQHFLMEKRLDALVPISAAFSEVTGVFYRYTAEKQNAPPEHARQEYNQALLKVREVVNRHLIVLGQEFDKQASFYIQVHRSVRDVGVTKCAKYRNFISELDNQFNEFCRAILDGGEARKLPRLTLESIPLEERDRLTPQEYLDRQFNYWQRHK